MTYHHLIRLAEKFELKLELADEEPRKLLEEAFQANKGHGIQIYYHGQHFGWYRWDKDKHRHEQFSIADFREKDTIGKLEHEVANLVRVNLEDFIPALAGRKQV